MSVLQPWGQWLKLRKWPEYRVRLRDAGQGREVGEEKSWGYPGCTLGMCGSGQQQTVLMQLLLRPVVQAGAQRKHGASLSLLHGSFWNRQRILPVVGPCLHPRATPILLRPLLPIPVLRGGVWAHTDLPSPWGAPSAWPLCSSEPLWPCPSPGGRVDR